MALPLGGWLNLDLDGLFLATLRVGVLDGSGRASQVHAIPNEPSLSGLTFFAEALVLMPDDPVPYEPAAAIPVTIL
jgi:hypothetical protein